MASCRSCGAPIRFIRTRKGRAMPLDAEPSPRGNVVVASDNVAEVFPDPHAAKEAWGDRPRYLPHHASCPNWR